MTAAPAFMNLTGPEVGNLVAGGSFALIPVGQIVQHGPHLPIGTDVFQAEGMVAALASELTRRGSQVIVGPTIPFGYSPAQESFPGHVNLRPEVLKEQVEDVATCLGRQGMKRQVYVMFGPGAWWPLQLASTQLAKMDIADMIIIDGLSVARAVGMELLAGHDPASGKFDVHAGELETSLMLALKPDLVRMDRAVAHYSPHHALFAGCACSRGPLLQQMAAFGLRSWREFGEDGVTGDATLATAEKGREIISRAVAELANHIGALQG